MGEILICLKACDTSILNNSEPLANFLILQVILSMVGNVNINSVPRYVSELTPIFTEAP